MKTITFYFDFLSPFSYFAWLRHRSAIEHTSSLQFFYSPVLMGKLFSHHGFPGPGEILSKRNSELKKCFRYAYQNNIAFTPPETFPFNPLAIIRCATSFAAREQQEKVISLIFNKLWAKGCVLDDPDILTEFFESQKLDQGILQRSFEREAKLELKAHIKKATDSHIFGVPTFQIEDEFFWGNDSINDLNNYLAGNDNWNKKLYNSLISLS